MLRTHYLDSERNRTFSTITKRKSTKYSKSKIGYHGRNEIKTKPLISFASWTRNFIAVSDFSTVIQTIWTYNTYKAVLIRDVVGQFELVEGDDLLHPLFPRRRTVGVDVHPFWHFRICLAGHHPPTAKIRKEGLKTMAGRKRFRALNTGRGRMKANVFWWVVKADTLRKWCFVKFRHVGISVIPWKMMSCQSYMYDKRIYICV